MSRRPLVVAFDVIGTLFSLAPLRGPFEAAGLPGEAVDLWFSIALRDAFALGAAGQYRPFEQLLDSAVGEACAVHGRDRDEELAAALAAGMKCLPAQVGAPLALAALRGAGIRLFALSNGAHSATRNLLARADLLAHFEAILSTDEVGTPKPFAPVYRYLLDRAGTDPAETALVAAHGWDLQGAAALGLRTAYVQHRPWPPALDRPDAEGRTLIEVAEALLAPG